MPINKYSYGSYNKHSPYNKSDKFSFRKTFENGGSSNNSSQQNKYGNSLGKHMNGCENKAKFDRPKTFI